MNGKEKLEGFISDLNLMLEDDLLFPEKRDGKFILSIKPINNGVEIHLFFRELDDIHPFFYKKYVGKEDEWDDFCLYAYCEILRVGILNIDCVDKFKDAEYGFNINILCFATLLTTGLDKLRK